MSKSIVWTGALCLALTLGAAGWGCGGGGGSGGSSNTAGEVGLALIDAPIDDLATLVLDLTEVRLVRTDRTTAVVFAPAAAVPVDIASLRNRNFFASVASVPPGAYGGAEIDFSAAAATDLTGGAVVVSPSSGTIVIDFDSPVAVLAGSSSGLEIDIDGDQLVLAVDTGAGTATLGLTIVDAEVENGAIELDDFDGVVTAISATTLEVRVEHDGNALGTVTVEVPGGTARFAVGDEVEVEGTFQANGTVLATRIEIESAAGGGGGPDELEGVIASIGGTVAQVLLIEVERGASPTVTNGVVTVDFTNATITRDGSGSVPAGAPFPGQRIEARGLVQGGNLVAANVELRETDVDGTVSAVGLLQVAVTAIERFAIAQFPALPATVEVAGTGSATFAIGGAIELEGFFTDGATPAGFDSLGSLDSELESLEPANASVVSTDVFEADFEDGNVDLLVQVLAGATIEREEAGDVTTIVTLAEFMQDVAAGVVEDLEIEGAFVSGQAHDFEATEIEYENYLELETEDVFNGSVLAADVFQADFENGRTGLIVKVLSGATIVRDDAAVSLATFMQDLAAGLVEEIEIEAVSVSGQAHDVEAGLLEYELD